MLSATPELQDFLAALNPRERDKLLLLTRLYPELATPKHKECLDILRRAEFAELPAKSVLISENNQCRNFLFLLQGTIRVFQGAEDGREITLYRINPGDICIMSLNSLLNNKPFHASACCDSDVKAMLINKDDFHRAMAVSENFRQMVLSSLTNSVNEVTHNFHDMAFRKLDVRLACLLGRLLERGNTESIQVTHQELAQELGTSREVISRLLKQFEQQGCITLSRNCITINKKSSLEWFDQ